MHGRGDQKGLWDPWDLPWSVARCVLIFLSKPQTTPLFDQLSGQSFNLSLQPGSQLPLEDSLIAQVGRVQLHGEEPPKKETFLDLP